MSRKLFIPMVICTAAFVAVYFVQASTADSNLENAKAGNALSDFDPTQLLTSEEAKTLLQEGWPTKTSVRRALASRGMPRNIVYATATAFPAGWETEAAHFLCRLDITSLRDVHSFPVIIDRISNQISIFDSNKWVAYEDWKADTGATLLSGQSRKTDRMIFDVRS